MPVVRQQSSADCSQYAHCSAQSSYNMRQPDCKSVVRPRKIPCKRTRMRFLFPYFATKKEIIVEKCYQQMFMVALRPALLYYVKINFKILIFDL